MDSAQPPGPKGGTALSYTKPDPAERTVNSLLLRNAERAPDSPLVFDEAGTLTRGGALEMARRMSNAFSRVGLGQGDTVGIMLDNRREFLAAWFGASALGAIEVPTLVVAGEDDLRYAAIAERTAATIGANARAALVPAAGHSAHLEQPRRFIDLLLGAPAARDGIEMDVDGLEEPVERKGRR